VGDTEKDVRIFPDFPGTKITADTKYINENGAVFNLHQRFNGRYSYLEPEVLKEFSSQYKDVSVILIVSTGPWWRRKFPDDFADRPFKAQQEELEQLIQPIVETLKSLPINFDIFRRGPDLHYCNEYSSEFIANDNYLQMQIYHTVKNYLIGSRIKFFDILKITTTIAGGKIGNKYFKTINKGVYDCLHWCLPGIPDIWNKAFFSYMCQTK